MTRQAMSISMGLLLLCLCCVVARAEYLVVPDRSMGWRVVDVMVIPSPAADGAAFFRARVKTSPPFGVPPAHSRLAVMRNGAFLGIVRVWNRFGDGFVCGPFARTVPPASLRRGDDLFLFSLKRLIAFDAPAARKRLDSICAGFKAGKACSRDDVGFLMELSSGVVAVLEGVLDEVPAAVRDRLRGLITSLKGRPVVNDEIAAMVDLWTGELPPPEKRGFLGISFEDVGGYRGVKVVRVIKGMPARRCGLKRGDVIVKIGPYRVFDGMDLIEIVSSLGPGKQVEMEVLRRGKKLRLKVRLTHRPPAQLPL